MSMKLKLFILFTFLPFHLLMAQPTLGWGSIDIRYSRTEVPETTKKSPLLRAWRGERVSAQNAAFASTSSFASRSSAASDRNGTTNSASPQKSSRHYSKRRVRKCQTPHAEMPNAARGNCHRHTRRFNPLCRGT